MNTFRFHLISLAHLPQSAQYSSCAFTQKNRKMAKMLTSLGHEVFFYGAEGSDIEAYCNSDKLHFVQTHTLADIRASYGDPGNDQDEIGYDWRNLNFRVDYNSERKPVTLKFYTACVRAINAVKQPDDILLLSQGYYHKPIADAVKLFLTCELGIGYRGSYAPFRAFESTYIQNFTYGSEHPREGISGSHYDRVIPSYFDPADFAYGERKDDFFLFMGRMIKRKGIVIAYDACEAIGAKLVIAGQGAHVTETGSLLPNETPDFELPAGHWEYVGFADAEKRKSLLARARALFAPTEYLEPFGSVVVEALLSGTPVITTDFGAFPDLVQNGRNGYRCHTLRDFMWAAQHVRNLNSSLIQREAERYWMDNVRWDYERWFDDLHLVWESANDPSRKGWHRLSADEPGWRGKIRW
jgi:glycosyltransferase involved in cell wall biosynthesis